MKFAELGHAGRPQLSVQIMGRYWGWALVETWSLITWLIYGVYLQMRRFFIASFIVSR